MILRFRVSAPQTLTLSIRGPLPYCHVLLAHKVAAAGGANRLRVTATHHARPLPKGRYLIRLSRPRAVVLERILALRRRSARPRFLRVEPGAAGGLCVPTSEARAQAGVRSTTGDHAVQAPLAPVAEAPASSVTKTSPHVVAGADGRSAAMRTPEPSARDRGTNWLLVAFVLVGLAAVAVLLGAPEAGHRYRARRYRSARSR